MKLFMYFEAQEGGMDNWLFEGAEKVRRYFQRSWKSAGCEEDDAAFEQWIDNAEVGQYYEHRMGVAVRLADTGD
jgi:hypothetical protein